MNFNLDMLKDYVYILYYVAGFLVIAIPAIISFATAAKAKRKAKTAEEKEKANNEMLLQANALISAAEATFKNVDTVLKSQGSSAGSVKKEIVMSKLKTFADNSGINFDSEYWSTKIDELVKFTKSVNSK